MIPHEKQILRERMKSVLATFPDKAAASLLLAARLEKLACWQQAKVIYGFSPLSSEPDWRPVASGKIVAYPRIEGGTMNFYLAEDFQRGTLGAMEPLGHKPAPPPDLILVPGLAFDTDRHRLGRGKGFYDRWLQRGGGVVSLGLCFECQRLPTVLRESHDMPMDAVLTETSCLPCTLVAS